jgi:hypothetical protein
MVLNMPRSFHALLAHLELKQGSQKSRNAPSALLGPIVPPQASQPPQANADMGTTALVVPQQTQGVPPMAHVLWLMQVAYAPLAHCAM